MSGLTEQMAGFTSRTGWKHYGDNDTLLPALLQRILSQTTYLQLQIWTGLSEEKKIIQK